MAKKGTGADAKRKKVAGDTSVEESGHLDVTEEKAEVKKAASSGYRVKTREGKSVTSPRGMKYTQTWKKVDDPKEIEYCKGNARLICEPLSK